MGEHEHKIGEDSVIRTERVEIAEPGTEGCVEHYNERVIVTDKNYASQTGMDRLRNLTEMQKIIVLGESLGTPRSKKRFRPR